jgi:hypothetical protein
MSLEHKPTAAALTAIMDTLEEVMPETGLVLLTFPDGDPNLVNYISNRERNRVVPALKQLVKKLDQQASGTPNRA